MTGEGPTAHPWLCPARPLLPGTETQDQVSQELSSQVGRGFPACLGKIRWLGLLGRFGEDPPSGSVG